MLGADANGDTRDARVEEEKGVTHACVGETTTQNIVVAAMRNFMLISRLFLVTPKNWISVEVVCNVGNVRRRVGSFVVWKKGKLGKGQK